MSSSSAASSAALQTSSAAPRMLGERRLEWVATRGATLQHKRLTIWGVSLPRKLALLELALPRCLFSLREPRKCPLYLASSVVTSSFTRSLLGVSCCPLCALVGLHDQHCDPYAVPALRLSMSILACECLSHLQHAGGNELLQLGADVRVLVRVRVRVRVRVG